jgi:hypothetical protein
MSRTIVTFRKSRYYRICVDSSWAHDRGIRPGDVYARLSVPPNDVRDTWFTDILCTACLSPEDYAERSTLDVDYRGR